ncbi:MAG: hypothetical protein WCK67_04100 [bacterium]
MNISKVGSFNSDELMKLYLNKNYDQITQKFIEVLVYYKNNTLFKMDDSSYYFINIFVENLMYFFTKPDYIVRVDYARTLIDLNMVISNLVAMTRLKNTDTYIEILQNQPNNYLKILILYSARNTIRINIKELFDANIEFGLRWYLAYFFIGGYVNELMYDNFIYHLKNIDERFVPMHYQIHVAYQISSYYGDGLDKKIKGKINELIKTMFKNLTINNSHNKKKIAVITKRWNARSSIYRTCYGFVESLKDNYELTLINTGEPYPEIEKGLFNEVKNIKFINGKLDLSAVIDNDYMLIYYPDIGLGAESIYLSNLRIAPIQIAGYGHPVSTYGSEIDYFIGGEEVEFAELAEENYAERLVLLPGNASPPALPQYEIKNIQNKTDKFIISCSWGAMKINYPMLQNLKKIIDKSEKKVLFRIYGASGPTRYNCFIPLKNEIASVLGIENFELIRNVNYNTYMSLIEESDISIDSYPYGGYNTAVDMVYLRKPLVAYEGKKFFNRSASSLLRILGLEELITHNDEEYINLILKLINEDEYRLNIIKKLNEIDLNKLIFEEVHTKEFKIMIDYLIKNHKTLQKKKSKEPIFISKLKKK